MSIGIVLFRGTLVRPEADTSLVVLLGGCRELHQVLHQRARSLLRIGLLWVRVDELETAEDVVKSVLLRHVAGGGLRPAVSELWHVVAGACRAVLALLLGHGNDLCGDAVEGKRRQMLELRLVSHFRFTDIVL